MVDLSHLGLFPFFPTQLKHVITKLRKEAVGSLYYPFLNWTESVSVLNMFTHRLSEKVVDRIHGSFRGGSPHQPGSAACFVCW